MKNISSIIKGKLYRNSICWYTNLALTKKQRSIEHLVTVSSKIDYRNSSWNLVCCHYKINGIVGNAPLKLKFALRKKLQEIDLTSLTIVIAKRLLKNYKKEL